MDKKKYLIKGRKEFEETSNLKNLKKIKITTSLLLTLL
jgi:hypothetical protein